MRLSEGLIAAPPPHHALATTPCPFCAADVRIPKGEDGDCPACGEALRFIDAPELKCQRCGKMVAYNPNKDAARCKCGHWQAIDGRTVRFEADCPRCRRSVEVPAHEKHHVCPHCDTAMVLQDTF